MPVKNNLVTSKGKFHIFSRMGNREDALKFVREVSVAYFVIAALLSVFGAFLFSDLAYLFDIAVYIIGGVLLLKFSSRIAAVVLFITLVKTLAGLGSDRSFIFAALILWIAMRAIEATFKLHGRFRLTQQDQDHPPMSMDA